MLCLKFLAAQASSQCWCCNFFWRCPSYRLGSPDGTTGCGWIGGPSTAGIGSTWVVSVVFWRSHCSGWFRSTMAIFIYPRAGHFADETSQLLSNGSCDGWRKRWDPLDHSRWDNVKHTNPWCWNTLSPCTKIPRAKQLSDVISSNWFKAAGFRWHTDIYWPSKFKHPS